MIVRDKIFENRKLSLLAMKYFINDKFNLKVSKYLIY